MKTQPTRSVSVYLSYAQEDEALKQEFEDYLAIMQQGQVISEWIEHQIQQGTDWSQVIDPRLLVADFVLAFLSPRLLSSGYCFGAEVREMFERRARGDIYYSNYLAQCESGWISFCINSICTKPWKTSLILAQTR